ncbi:MAG: HAMP domain-containing sensor histidine kinase [Pseudomonadota bacterium]
MDKSRFWGLISELTAIANAGRPKFAFFKQLQEAVFAFFPEHSVKFTLLDEAPSKTGGPAGSPEIIAKILQALADDAPSPDPPPHFLLEQGRAPQSHPPGLLSPEEFEALGRLAGLDLGTETETNLALLPIAYHSPERQLLLLRVAAPQPFTPASPALESIFDLARSTAAAIAIWQRSWALNERIKEQTCLYQMAHLLERKDNSLEDVFLGVTGIIPPAWLYANSAAARVVLDGVEYAKPGYPAGRQCQSADIIIQGTRRGFVEVCYLKEKPLQDEGPFLKEERNLLEIVARELSLIAEGKLKEKEMADLKEQLQHANRLTMTGQVAAAVAHELNEPLTNIIGFAQLAAKTPRLPAAARKDLEKIVATSLHAREIVRRLLMFSKKMPSQLEKIDINAVVEDSLAFLDQRSLNLGVSLEFEPSPTPLPLLGDANQLKQVVFNLVLNALQATPRGGRVIVSTASDGAAVRLLVKDTGQGMTRDILDRIFIPFFSTKPPGQGTGLGLSVVKEIIDSYRGTIRFESRPGKGTTVAAVFPSAPEGR